MVCPMSLTLRVFPVPHYLYIIQQWHQANFFKRGALALEIHGRSLVPFFQKQMVSIVKSSMKVVIVFQKSCCLKAMAFIQLHRCCVFHRAVK